FTTVVLALLTAGLVALAIINFQQRGIYQLPDDGVSWLDTPAGVKAWIVVRDGPAGRAGVEEGDLLQAIDGTRIKRAAEAQKAIFRSGVWSQATYQLSRAGQAFATSVVIGARPQSRLIGSYLEIVGLLYLAIGIFILIRRWGAPKSLHFFLFCL